MLVAFMLGLTSSLTIGACSLKSGDVIELASRNVTIGDVLNAECIVADRRDDISSLIIARMGEPTTTFALTQRALKSLIHRRVPGIAFAASTSDADTRELRIARKAPDGAPTPNCFSARKPIAKGAVVSRSDLSRSTCEETPETARTVRFDRTDNVLRATREIDSGEPVGAFAPPDMTYDRNEPLMLSVGIGPVRIERQVTALQPFTSGETVFVRDQDGQIFSLPTLAPPSQESSK